MSAPIAIIMMPPLANHSAAWLRSLKKRAVASTCTNPSATRP
jgi:hypothetical protein